MSEYFIPSGIPATGTFGQSILLRTEFVAIQAAFTTKFPVLAGNAYKLTFINATGTGMTVAGSLLTNAAGNLGIGKSPTTMLDVNGTTTSTLFVGPLTGNVTGNVTGSSGSTTGNAATATALATARLIGGTSFDGSANITPGLASTATALATARTIGGTSFDGTANVAVALATAATTAGTVTTAAQPAITSVGALSGLTVTAAIIGSVAGSSGSTTGNAATATALANPRAINGTNFDGTAPITVRGTLLVDSLNVSAPNGTVPVAVLTVTDGGYANIDAALRPKGTGAITAHVADSVAAGGNKRGTYAVDLQLIRALASQVASGTRAFIGGGESNTSSGTMAAVVGGNGCTASGDYSSIGGGQTNTASGTNSVVPGGGSNNASGSYSFANGTRADTRTRFASSALGCGAFNQNGASQSVLMSIGRQTIDATATILTADGNAAVANNQYTVANSSASQFSILVIAGVMDAGNSKSWTITGLVKRGVNAASTVLVGSTVTSNFADAGAASWVIAVTADTTNGGITLTATGQAATTIRWVATVRATEMTY